MYSLRVAASGRSGSITRLVFALGGGRGGEAPGLVAPAAVARSVSATTSNAAVPTPGDQGVSMDQGKQPPRRDAAGEQGNTHDVDVHMTTGDVMTHSFGVAYSTRSDEEGFGGVYGQNDLVLNRGIELHQSHPDSEHSTIPVDVMSHSFGVAYSTRSDYEGFGGVYGRNDPVDPSHLEHSTTPVDVMSRSFGVAYSTRSDDEGFGGVYGHCDQVDPSHPKHNTSQGSEVKDKSTPHQDEKRET